MNCGGDTDSNADGDDFDPEDLDNLDELEEIYNTMFKDNDTSSPFDRVELELPPCTEEAMKLPTGTIYNTH